MKISLILLATFISLCAVAATSTPDNLYNVNIAVSVNNKLLMKFDIAAPPDGTIVVSSGRAVQLEIETASLQSKRPQTVVRLMDISGDKPRILHTSESTDPSTVPRSIGYTICDGHVSMSNPAPATPDPCP